MDDMFQVIFPQRLYIKFLATFLTTFSHNIFSPHFLTTFSHHIHFSPHFLTTFSHHIFSPHFLTTFSPHYLTTFSHHIFSPHFLTTFSHHIFSPHFLTTFSHHILTTLPHHIFSPHFLTTFFCHFSPHCFFQIGTTIGIFLLLHNPDHWLQTEVDAWDKFTDLLCSHTVMQDALGFAQQPEFPVMVLPVAPRERAVEIQPKNVRQLFANVPNCKNK
jgi:hypothetical protein